MSEKAKKSLRHKFMLKPHLWVVTSVICLMALGIFVGEHLVRRPVPTATPLPTSSASPSPTTTSTPSVTPTATPISWSTADYSYPFAGTVPPLPLLTYVQTFSGPFSGGADNFDRISFTFSGTHAPGFTVKYVDNVVRDGSGAPVTLTGKALLQIVFNPSAAHDDNGNPSLPQKIMQPVNTGYAGIQSYVMNGDFEGYVSVALGTAAKNGFSTMVVNQSGRWVLSVDVARP